MNENELKLRRIKHSAPVFIMGCQRSGTSFLFRLMERYLDIGFGRDNGHFIRLKKMLPYYGNLENQENIRRLLMDIITIPEFSKRFAGLDINIEYFIKNLEDSTYAEILRRFYSEWALFNGHLRWGGKTPDYTLEVNELHDLFPDGKYIHIIRDGRDVALSLLQQKWGPQNVFVAAHYWDKRVRSGRDFGGSIGDSSFLEIRYENLLSKPEQEFTRLLDFIEGTEDCEGIMNRFCGDINELFMRNNFNKWKTKMSRNQIKVFELAVGRLLLDLNYDVMFPEVIKTHPSSWMRLYYNVDNLTRKLIRGQGFRGLYQKMYRYIFDFLIKIKGLIFRLYHS